jgi:NAD(P) transhydrogenase subunit alpha
MAISIGVPRETVDGERRVGLVPEVAGRLIKSGFNVSVEAGAGEKAFFSDQDYEAAGARIVGRDDAFNCDVVAKVQPPDENEVGLMRADGVVVGFLRPLDDLDAVKRLVGRGVTALSMELVPRITRAQKMDALSAMGTVGGYRAVLVAAELLPKFFPLLTTAAGTMRPARVFVLGAGVAGLQAIATARRLGAIVSAYDVRPVVREEVQSLGAKFVELELETEEAEGAGGYAAALAEEKQRRQTELLVPHLAESDVVITTALIPGRAAPILITKQAVEEMGSGSVIIDLAAPNGGNCELSEPGQTVVKHGVTIAAPLNLPSDMPVHASQMYARTVSALVSELNKEGELAIDLEDEVVGGACVTHDGKIINERVAALLEPQSV